MADHELLECVINVSEGRDLGLIEILRRSGGPAVLDIHCDADHNRSVFTLAGWPAEVEQRVRNLTATAVKHLDLTGHVGVHPRIGVVDVVPWVALRGWPLADGQPQEAVDAQQRFARWAGTALALPCFCYGFDRAGHPSRSLPEIRRGAWVDLAPDSGPPEPHPTAGAAAVGARPILIAYNLWLADADLAQARAIASQVRSSSVRALGLAVASGTQVSCNLIAPLITSPADIFDTVAQRAAVTRAELVGLIPRRVLETIPSHRWAELDLDPSKTIEARLEQAGLDGGRTESGSRP